jgi:predicted amidophosphoribosyltransferase
VPAKWREQKGNAAEQMAEAMARRLLKLRKDAKALKQLSAEKQEKKMKAKKNK